MAFRQTPPHTLVENTQWVFFLKNSCETHFFRNLLSGSVFQEEENCIEAMEILQEFVKLKQDSIKQWIESYADLIALTFRSGLLNISSILFLSTNV